METFIGTDTASIELLFSILTSGTETSVVPWDQLLYACIVDVCRLRMSSAHSPTFPSLHLRHNSFSNPSVALLMSQLILHPFRCFSYITVHSPTLLLLLLRHRIFTYVIWRAAQGVHLVMCPRYHNSYHTHHCFLFHVPLQVDWRGRSHPHMGSDEEDGVNLLNSRRYSALVTKKKSAIISVWFCQLSTPKNWWGLLQQIFIIM